MAITSVGTPSLVRSTTSPVTASWGTGQQPTAAGNLMVAVVTAVAATSVTATAQNSGTTGWTKYSEAWNSTTNAGHVAVSVWTKTSAGSDAAPAFTSTLTGTGAMTVTLYNLSGAIPVPYVDTSGTEASSGSGTGTATVTSTAVTTSGNVTASGEFAIMVAARERTAGTTTVTGSAGWNLDVNDGATSSVSHTGVQSYAGPPTGSTLAGTVSWSGTGTTAYGAGLTVVFQAITPGPALNQPWSTPAGYRTIISRVGLAMASVIPIVTAAPPPITSGPPVHAAAPSRSRSTGPCRRGVSRTSGPGRASPSPRAPRSPRSAAR